ncbi:hypothetical protein QUF79_25700 [Fictibacillus enclensis]|uniref:hypothetical protein n=1 Tax=Fictibacillus enclensis TaxID=1017270 RepID=UPI0025A0857B|nr:hypothetical protein [Fictibacillus enclensis]MDM5201426.1 hypothetical protein [Fictibacillus enclensis]
MKFTFTSCDVSLPKLSLSYGKSGIDETRKAFRRYPGSSDKEVGDYAAQAQRPPEESEQPETEINPPIHQAFEASYKKRETCCPLGCRLLLGKGATERSLSTS